MQTRLAPFIDGTPQGREAEAILRRCVHCGFCNATCPTYRLFGDELDGPRGRIYLVKQLLEGSDAGARTQLHLDRCLTCRACETTCPSGVKYSRLADIGRGVMESRSARGVLDRAKRRVLAAVLPNRALFGMALLAAQSVTPLLPKKWRPSIPRGPANVSEWPPARHARSVLVIRGCVQADLAPATNAAAARVLDRLGLSLVEVTGAGCCGALRYHLGYQARGLDDARAVIDALLERIEKGGVEAIAMTASGCGAMVREYAELLADDPEYAAKAAKVRAMTQDLSEIVVGRLGAVESLRAGRPARGRVAFQAPCTLQHAQKVSGVVERILTGCGWDCVPVRDADQCCGSAGTYSLLQPDAAMRLRSLKLEALEADRPDVIATANIGCQIHLRAASRAPVRHWIELVAESLSEC